MSNFFHPSPPIFWVQAKTLRPINNQKKKFLSKIYLVWILLGRSFITKKLTIFNLIGFIFPCYISSPKGDLVSSVYSSFKKLFEVHP